MYIYFDMIKEFSCEMCGACCQREWSVTLDEESYERNRQLFMATGREIEFNEVFIPLTHKSGLGEYAYIKKKTTGGCWFLKSDHRCSLQVEAGHEQLDTVCQIYPRYPMNTVRGMEITLSFSCPAVLTLASRLEPLQLIRSEQPPIAIDENHSVSYVYPQQQSSHHPLRYYFELEQHFIDIMQCRNMSVGERLEMILVTAQNIHNLVSDEFLSQQLTAIFYNNYEVLDAKTESGELISQELADILLENFFVNFIFKKPFYIYGLERTCQLFLTIWQRIKKARQNVTPGTMDIECTKAIIMEVELEYSHNRQVLFNEFLRKS